MPFAVTHAAGSSRSVTDLSLQVTARPSAARARQAARLLHKLCALMPQRRSKALLGRCLRLGARLGAYLVLLGTSA